MRAVRFFILTAGQFSKRCELMSITVTDAYLVAITAESEYTTFLSKFEFIPPGAREGMTLGQSGFGHLGNRLYQLNNGMTGMANRWNSLEHNRTILNGTGEYVDVSAPMQTGEWSTTASRIDCTFATPPRLELVLDREYDLIGLQIHFDDLGEEWATEIKVSYYNAAHVLMQARLFPNDSAQMPVDWQYNGVKCVEIEVIRWNKPLRFAKICQVIPGQIRYFRDDNIYSFRFKESISLFGSLTIPEYTITFPNEDQVYNIINPTGLVSKLRERMNIPAQIGIVTPAGVEYVNTGDFPLFSWPNNANDETAAFVCRPDLAFAYENYVHEQLGTRTSAVTAADISMQANLETPIQIDARIPSATLNGNIGDSVPLQNALSQLAIALGGYVKFERDGAYTIKPFLPSPATREITYDNMWGKPAISQTPLLAGVRMKYLAYNFVNNRMDAVEISSPKINETGRVVDITSNFIRNSYDATLAGEIALDFFARRLSYTVSYRGDMSIEAGDIVSVETDYGFQDVFVMEHEITYDNKDFLQGKITGVGL